MENKKQKFIYNYEEAAFLLSMTRNALRDLVYRGRAPKTIKLGTRTFFAHKDIEEWIETLRSVGH